MAGEIDDFLDKNLEDVLHTSNIHTNFKISGSNRNKMGRPALPLGWIVSDGTNRTVEEINEKKVANGTSPGGGNAGAMITSLQNLEPYYGTQFFLIDLEIGEVFTFVHQQWRRAGLYCTNQPFVVDELLVKMQRNGHAMQTEFEAEEQMSVVDIRRTPSQFERPPPLPAMDELRVYVLHPDTMQIKTRKN